MNYEEPILSVLVLDFMKEKETRDCLGSIKSHVKVPHQVIYLHNGVSDYPAQLFKEGLIDHLIQRKSNGGLGLGTRDLFAAAFSPYCLYLQNDQQLVQDITDTNLRYFATLLDRSVPHSSWIFATIKSVSIAGPVGGQNIYSERAHFVKTSFYKEMETAGVLGHYGAGPYHDGTWRERQIQEYYRKNHFIHDTSLPTNSFVQDNGRRAVRENPDGSLWEHRPDTKELKLIQGPVKEKHIYPNFTDEEWKNVIITQTWVEWQIPEKEKEHSFRAWTH